MCLEWGYCEINHRSGAPHYDRPGIQYCVLIVGDGGNRDWSHFNLTEVCLTDDNWYLVWKNNIISTWWRYQMEILSMLLALCKEKPQFTNGFPHKSQWRGYLMFSLIFPWTNGWVNDRHASDVRRHCPHYDATVMSLYTDVIITHAMKSRMI